jgi:hypothetical protein
MVRFLLVFLLTLIGTAQAQIVDSPRGLAMSGVRADPVGSSAIMYNPAGLSRSYMYAVEAQYFRGGPGNRNGLGVNIVDSKAQPLLPVGLSYGFQFTDGEPEVSEKGHDVRLAFAHPAIPDRFNVGVSLRYLAIERDKTGEEYPDLQGFTLNIGALISLSSLAHIGLVGENLIEIDNPDLPRRAGAAIAYTGGPLVFDLDVLMDFDSHKDGAKAVIATGLELLLSGAVPLRAGYIKDLARDTAWLSGGLGFMTGQDTTGGQLSLTYRHNLEETDVFNFGVAISLFL